MFDRVARVEILEVGIVVGQVRELRVLGLLIVGRDPGSDLDLLGFDQCVPRSVPLLPLLFHLGICEVVATLNTWLTTIALFVS